MSEDIWQRRKRKKRCGEKGILRRDTRSWSTPDLELRLILLARSTPQNGAPSFVLRQSDEFSVVLAHEAETRLSSGH